MRALAPARNWRSRSERRCGGCTACRPTRRRMPRCSGAARRSGIGIALFGRGGLVVDGGHGQRRDCRRCWRACRCRQTGASCWCSTAAARGCRARPSGPRSRPCRRWARRSPGRSAGLVLMQALPALAEADLRGFRRRHHAAAGAARRSFRPRPGRPLSPAHASPRRWRAGGGRRGRHRPELVGADRLRLPARRSGGSAGACGLAASGAAEGLEFLICRALNRGTGAGATCRIAAQQHREGGPWPISTFCTCSRRGGMSARST